MLLLIALRLTILVILFILGFGALLGYGPLASANYTFWIMCVIIILTPPVLIATFTCQVILMKKDRAAAI